MRKVEQSVDTCGTGVGVFRFFVSDIPPQSRAWVQKVQVVLGQSQPLISWTVFHSRNDRGVGGLLPESRINGDATPGLQQGGHR